jgi:hypothetical protein
VAAVRRDLEQLPEELQLCTEAVSAVALAMSIDANQMVATCTRELRTTMAGLRARAMALRMAGAPLPRPSEKESPVADLTARIAAARRGDTTG